MMLEEWYFELMRLKNAGLNVGAMKGRTMNDLKTAFEHFKEEWNEFIDAYAGGHLRSTLKELADLSNMCDLFFEELWKLKRGSR